MAKGVPLPWSLDLAMQCMDMQTGEIRHMLRAGGLLDQSGWLIEQMRYAYKTYAVYNKQEKNMNDLSFINWVNK